MRTSLAEIEKIEAHIFEGSPLPAGDDIAGKTVWQLHTYRVVEAYGRKELKAELEAIHNKIFTGGSFSRFRRRVLRYFR